MAKKVGLALGAGSSRGLAHIGVIRALKEENIPIDCVAGTSMGAAIGAMYVCGCDLEMMPGFLEQIDEKLFFDYKIPKKGVIGGNKFEELLKLFTKGMSFEETEIPYCCVACDLLKGKAHVFDAGKIYPAVRCSISIPGVFEPYHYQHSVFVDGAVVDRVPITACREMAAKPDVVIGVDVGYAGTPNHLPKNMIDTLMITFDIMGWEAARLKMRLADYMIMPKLSHIDPYKINQAKECVELGYAETMKQMPGIKRLLAE